MDRAARPHTLPDGHPSTACQIVDLAAASARLHSEPYPPINGHRGMVVVRHSRMTSILFAMQAESQLDHHRVEGGATVQLLRGQLRVVVDGAPRTLNAGQLLVVAPGRVHTICAVQPSEMLLTVHPATVDANDPCNAPIEPVAVPLFGHGSRGTTGPILVATTGKSARDR